MTAAVLPPRGDVIATLNFYSPPEDNSKPYNNVDPNPGQPPRNYGSVSHNATIHDIRGHETEYSLDRDAFQVLLNVPESVEKEFVDEESIKTNYYPEVEKLLLDNIPGTNRVYIFDHTIRRSRPDAPRQPVNQVHIDQTAKSVAKRVQRYFPDEAEKLLQGRYRIVNVWRPLNKKPVESNPLSFASTSSLLDQDVVPIEHRYQKTGYVGETAGIKHNSTQRWHYISGMTGSERLFLECFDSESLKEGSKIGGRAPHTAFVDPRSPADAEGRESIEVRALVFGP
ncbi:hypothetical protein VHEMI00714 [[Torrubiella] hemipterigena]|uniref:7alpha-cephem-methoxylase P8 chain related protein n=1 Tax=[Torrubiella] hemipterigena TaxID=1531966 RepID=A0A0A1T353_9HYPO|nr:hypothetical protein VHEMI00714 [[Torrubiella] hemipterigena]